MLTRHIAQIISLKLRRRNGAVPGEQFEQDFLVAAYNL
jgi:hypothetical protein